jgi:predicted transcriptional regulator
MGVSLTDEQRRRLEKLAERASRSMSNMIGFLIDLEYESQAAYQERETENVKAQNLEPETV